MDRILAFADRSPTYAGILLMLVWAAPMIVYAFLNP